MKTQYEQRLANLMELYEIEPNDLTEEEYQELVDAGCIDD